MFTSKVNLLFGERYFFHVCAVVFAVLLCNSVVFVVVAKNVSAVKNTFHSPLLNGFISLFKQRACRPIAICVAAGAAATVNVTFNE